MKYQFELVDGNDKQIEILYELLLNRVHSISHADIPDYKSHQWFVKNYPYLCWFLVKSKEDYLGSFYIKNDNSIGLNLKITNSEIVSSCLEFINKKYRPHAAQASMVSEYFYMNVATSNKELIAVMESLNIPQLQISFKL